MLFSSDAISVNNIVMLASHHGLRVANGPDGIHALTYGGSIRETMRLAGECMFYRKIDPESVICLVGAV